ncbi:MAG: AAA family ATPase, partial [Thermoanaerobaculia bacterium]
GAKSNAVYTAYGAVRAFIAEDGTRPVPLHIRNAPTKLMKSVGYGSGYRYAHDTAEKTAGLSCLPDSLAGRNYYRPSGEGREKDLKARAETVRALREKLRKINERD